MRRLLGNQDGIALPTAMAVLAIVSLLSAWTAAGGLEANEASTQDRDSKRALAAAEAGLQVGRHLLQKRSPAPGMCPTVTGTAVPAGGECPPQSGDLGTGARYTFHISTELGAGSQCVTLVGQLLTGPQRCITSSGTVNGVTRRIQARVVTTPATPPLVSVKGILGLRSVNIGNNADIEADVGSNGLIHLGNNADVGNVDLAPGAYLTGKKINQNVGSPRDFPNDFTLRPVPVADTASNNNNAAIPAGSGYDPATREMVIDKRLDLPAGDYNFCRLDFDGAGALSAAPGAKIRIFIDAPDEVRPGSGCPSGAGWGGIDGKNGVSIGQPNGLPQQIELHIVGWPASGSYASQYGRSMVQVAKNNLDANALIYAPQTYVYVAKNNARINGAIQADEIYVKNNLDFVWDGNLVDEGASDSKVAQKVWRECRRAPTNASDPESGC